MASLPEEASEDREVAFRHAADILEIYEPILARELRGGCLHLHEGEPFFVLRAQDVTAAGVVREWIRMNESNANVELKIEMAHEIALSMDRYRGPRKNAD